MLSHSGVESKASLMKTFPPNIRPGCTIMCLSLKFDLEVRIQCLCCIPEKVRSMPFKDTVCSIMK